MNHELAEFRATAKVAIGPVKATFKGAVTLSDLDPPNGYKISGEGEGGVAGFAKGGATVRLTDAEGGTTRHGSSGCDGGVDIPSTAPAPT